MSNNKKKNGNELKYREFKPKTQNQSDYIRAIHDNIITIGYGPSGTGKSMGAIGVSTYQLISGNIKRLLVSRSIIGCGKEIGTMPGFMDEKIAPYMYYVVEYLDYFIGKKLRERLIYDGQILLTPVEMVRGHTYNDSMMILDEAQNCSIKQLKLFMSRIGRNSKIILIGDYKQSDTPENGLKFCIDNMVNVNNVAIMQFTKADIIRHPIIGEILEIFDKN